VLSPLLSRTPSALVIDLWLHLSTDLNIKRAFKNKSYASFPENAPFTVIKLAANRIVLL
jgi:hypothetical protein